MSSPDRRNAPRHVPAYDRARLAFSDGAASRQAPARLRDISLGGAGIALDEPPTWPGPVWIGLEGMPAYQWVLAEVVRLEPDGRGGWRAGLKFAARCPDGFFRWAVSGETPRPIDVRIHSSHAEGSDEGPSWPRGSAWPRPAISTRARALVAAPGPRLIDTHYVARCLGF